MKNKSIYMSSSHLVLLVSSSGSGRAKLKISQESSEITRSHLSSRTLTASVKRTSGGKAPVDSILTAEEKENIIDQSINQSDDGRRGSSQDHFDLK